jgi:hypothetical protein
MATAKVPRGQPSCSDITLSLNTQPELTETYADSRAYDSDDLILL